MTWARVCELQYEENDPSPATTAGRAGSGGWSRAPVPGCCESRTVVGIAAGYCGVPQFLVDGVDGLGRSKRNARRLSRGVSSPKAA